MARTCYIHIGTHKTGTTSIQRFLALNRRLFADRGVLLPITGCDNAPDYVSHHQLAYELSGDSQFDATFGRLDALAAELRASGAHSACLSSENLSLLWHHGPRLLRLRDIVVDAGFTPKIICYLRPQASFCTSVYAQIVCYDRYRTPFRAYLADVLARPSVWDPTRPPFDYAKIIDAFSAAFGADSMIVCRYRSTAPDRELLFEFARRLLPTIDVRDLTFPPVRENGSLDFNTVLHSLGASRQSGRSRVKFAPLTVRDVLRFGVRFGAANEAIAARYRIRLPAFETIDLALASPLRRTWGKTQAVMSARRALARTHAGRPVLRWQPALVEGFVATLCLAVAAVSIAYGTRIASTALIEFGMLTIVVAVYALVTFVLYAFWSPSDAARRHFFDWSTRFIALGYIVIGCYALGNAVLDVMLARYAPDFICYPAALAAVAAALTIAAVRPVRARRLNDRRAGNATVSPVDDGMYLACCGVVLCAQLIHSIYSGWWLDTIFDIVVGAVAGNQLYRMRRFRDMPIPAPSYD